MNDVLFPIRPGTDADHAYVVNAWVMANRVTPIAKEFGKGYCARYKRIVRELLPYTRLTVACDAQDPKAIVGWAVTSRDVVHYVYVRHGFGHLGVASGLLKPFLGRTDVTYTHRPTMSAVRIPDGWQYMPLVVYLLEGRHQEIGAIHAAEGGVEPGSHRREHQGADASGT